MEVILKNYKIVLYTKKIFFFLFFKMVYNTYILILLNKIYLTFKVGKKKKRPCTTKFFKNYLQKLVEKPGYKHNPKTGL